MWRAEGTTHLPFCPRGFIIYQSQWIKTVVNSRICSYQNKWIYHLSSALLRIQSSTASLCKNASYFKHSLKVVEKHNRFKSSLVCLVAFFNWKKDVGKTHLEDNILIDQATGAVFWKSHLFKWKPERKTIEMSEFDIEITRSEQSNGNQFGPLHLGSKFKGPVLFSNDILNNPKTYWHSFQI